MDCNVGKARGKRWTNVLGVVELKPRRLRSNPQMNQNKNEKHQNFNPK